MNKKAMKEQRDKCSKSLVFYEFSAGEYFDGRSEPEMSPREERKTNTRRELIDGTVRTVANIGLENDDGQRVQ